MGTCGVCGKTTDGTFSYCYYHYSQKENKAGQLHGRHKCGGCNAQIAKDKSYCWSCKVKGKAKKSSWW